MSMFIEEFLEGEKKRLGNPKEPYTFVQYKNTDICLDFYCKCGAQLHYDGYFAYVLQCPHCNVKWEMPCHVIPRVSQRDDDICQVMESDEDV